MQISEGIEELKNKYPNVGFEVWDNQTLMGLFCGLNLNVQQIILSHYAENIYDLESYLGKLEVENITQDIDRIRMLKNSAQTLMNLFNTNDFVTPFHVDILGYIDFYINNLEKIEFNNENIIQIKNKSISDIHELLALIHKYTRATGYIAVMKRIEPWGEIKDENFDDVRDRILQVRANAYYSIKNLLDHEIILINQLKNTEN